MTFGNINFWCMPYVIMNFSTDVKKYFYQQTFGTQSSTEPTDRFWGKIDAKLLAGLQIPLGPTWSRSWVSGMSTKWETIALCRRQERDLHFYRAHQQSKCFAALETENESERGCFLFFHLAAQNGVCCHFKNSQAIDFGLITSKLQAIFAESAGEKQHGRCVFLFPCCSFCLHQVNGERKRKKERHHQLYTVSGFPEKKKSTWIDSDREAVSLRSQFWDQMHQCGGFYSAGNNEWWRAKWTRNIALKIGSAASVN